MKTMWCTVAALALITAQTASAANYCGDLRNAYGPFDYRARAAHVENFNMVEHAHFTADVENGIKGSSGYLGDDLGYTLHAIPNHHRALAAMARVAVRTKSFQLPGAKYAVDCYFERAMRFAPGDGRVRAEFGTYMFALGKRDKAFAAFREAAELEPENAAINYNLGLAYFQKQDYTEALVYAKKAYALGFPLPGLKNKLAAAGKWTESAEPAEAEPAAATPVDKPAG